MILVFTIKGLAAFGQGALLNRISCRIIAELQDRMFGRLMRSDLAEIHAAGSGHLVSRFTFDVQTLSTAVSNAIIGAGKDALTVIALVGVMFAEDWLLAAITFVVFPTAVIPIIYLGRRVRNVAKRMQTEIGSLNAGISQAFQGIRHIKAYNAEDRESERAGRVIWRVAALKQKAARIAFAISPIMEFLAGIAVVAVIVYGGSQVIAGERTTGSFVSFIAALLLAYDPMKRLARLNTQLQSGMAAAQRVFDLIDSRPKIVDDAKARRLDQVRGRITLTDVHFSYGADIPALHGINLEIPAGKTIALVGPSGAGKSTVLNLIPRFYDVQKGKVSVDGHDVRDVTMHSLREQMALVSQEVTLFDQSVRDNIAFSRPDATDEEIRTAAEAAAAHDFITQLSDGYDTMVGEQGVAPVRRTAAAPVDRPRDAQERADPSPRRSDIGARHGIRAAGAGRPEAADGGAHHLDGRAPLVHGGRCRCDLRSGVRTGRRKRIPCGVDRPAGPLRQALEHADRRADRQRGDRDRRRMMAPHFDTTATIIGP